MEVKIQDKQIEAYVVRKNMLTSNIERCFGIIWGQCSSTLQSRTKGLEEYGEKLDDLDTLWLILELKKIVSRIDRKSNPRVTLNDAIGDLYRMKQGATEANDSYLESSKSKANTVELAHGHHIF